jgi:hypothetical protein
MSIIDISLNTIDLLENKKKEFKYSCQKCNYNTNLLSSIKAHYTTNLHKNGIHGLRKYNEDVNLECNICKYKLKTVSLLQLHLLNNHSTKKIRSESFKFYCVECNFGTNSKSKYELHINSSKHKRNLDSIDILQNNQVITPNSN